MDLASIILKDAYPDVPFSLGYDGENNKIVAKVHFVMSCSYSPDDIDTVKHNPLEFLGLLNKEIDKSHKGFTDFVNHSLLEVQNDNSKNAESGINQDSEKTRGEKTS